jgi:hypothetical protein
MIRLKEGREIQRPRAGHMVLIDDIQYCERDLFKPVIMAQLGIKYVSRKGFDTVHFEKTGEKEKDDEATIIVEPVLKPMTTPAKLAKEILKKIKIEGRAAYKAAKERYDDLQDPEGLDYDPADQYITDFEQYRADLKKTFSTFKSEIEAIVKGTGTDRKKYDELLAYTWQDRWPVAPASDKI